MYIYIIFNIFINIKYLMFIEYRLYENNENLM